MVSILMVYKRDIQMMNLKRETVSICQRKATKRFFISG